MDRFTSANLFSKVYIITAFIDAHEEAQESFIRTLSGIRITSEEEMLAEQQKVLSDSREAVSLSRLVAAFIDAEMSCTIGCCCKGRTTLNRPCSCGQYSCPTNCTTTFN